MNRRSLKYKGVFQRCGDGCPKDRCRVHAWSFTVELALDNAGGRRQVSGSGFDSAKDAADARAEVLRQARDGELPTDCRITVADWLPRWLAGKVDRNELEAGTARAYRDTIKNHLIPRLGRKRLAELHGLDLTHAYSAIMRDSKAAYQEAIAAGRLPAPRPISAATIRRIHAVMSGALRSAVKQGLISRSVAPNADLPKVERKKVRPPEPEVFGAWLDAIQGDRLYPLWLMAGLSGLRRGELLGLKWPDIDLDTGRVVVRRQRVIGDGHQVEEREAKTDAGQDRVVYIDSDMVAALHRWRHAQEAERFAWGAAYHRGGYMFCHEDGRPLHPNYVTMAFGRLARQHGLDGVKLHGLRHFRASALISTGADIAAVSKALGHKSMAITSDTYGHLFEQAAKELAERAQGFVPRKLPGSQPESPPSHRQDVTVGQLAQHRLRQSA